MTDNRTTELLPCPFCGGEAVLLEPDESSTFYRVGCNCAHCIGANAVWHAQTSEAEAIAAWNARAERTCELSDNGTWGYPYVCSACDASFDADVNNGDFNYCPNCGAKVVSE